MDDFLIIFKKFKKPHKQTNTGDNQRFSSESTTGHYWEPF
jgi:hypothetical protein